MAAAAADSTTTSTTKTLNGPPVREGAALSNIVRAGATAGGAFGIAGLDFFDSSSLAHFARSTALFCAASAGKSSFAISSRCARSPNGSGSTAVCSSSFSAGASLFGAGWGASTSALAAKSGLLLLYGAATGTGGGGGADGG